MGKPLKGSLCLLTIANRSPSFTPAHRCFYHVRVLMCVTWYNATHIFAVTPFIEPMPAYVKISLQSIFREAAKRKELLKEVKPGLTLKDLLSELAREYGGEFKGILELKTDKISADVVVIVNGIPVRRADL